MKKIISTIFFWPERLIRRTDRWILFIALLIPMALVAVATITELNFSLVLHWYTYRLDNIPPWIPPSHGLVFLTALVWSRSRFAIRSTAAVRWLISAAALVYALGGLAGPRHDIVGAWLMMVFWSGYGVWARPKRAFIQ